MDQIRIIGPRDRKADYSDTVINTTSRGGFWSGLSPFSIGPCSVPNFEPALLMENAWQFSKVYVQFDNKGKPSKRWLDWAKKGFASSLPHRYPMGRGAKPEYSWWDGQALGYIDARKQIYVPLYRKAVRGTPAFKELKRMYAAGDQFFLWDFDGYDHERLGMSLSDVLNCSTRKMGHAFVLKMMLTGFFKKGA